MNQSDAKVKGKLGGPISRFKCCSCLYKSNIPCWGFLHAILAEVCHLSAFPRAVPWEPLSHFLSLLWSFFLASWMPAPDPVNAHWREHLHCLRRLAPRCLFINLYSSPKKQSFTDFLTASLPSVWNRHGAAPPFLKGRVAFCSSHHWHLAFSLSSLCSSWLGSQAELQQFFSKGLWNFFSAEVVCELGHTAPLFWVGPPFSLLSSYESIHSICLNAGRPIFPLWYLLFIWQAGLS